jgi:hypothetical protein
MPAYKIIKVRKSEARPYTPPEALFDDAQELKTPQRSGVLWAKLFSQHLGIPINQSDIQAVKKVPPRSQTRILASKNPRTLQHLLDSGPNPHGRKRALTRADTAAIADYLDDPTTSLNQRGAPWLDIAEAAGVDLPKTEHIKPLGKRVVEPQSVLRACKKDENLINAVCEEERDLTKYQAENRKDWKDSLLEAWPHSKDWNDVIFADEFHVGIGTESTKRIKRKRGSKYRYKKQNVHKKKVSSKDVKAKARENKHLKLLNVYVVLGRDFRKIIPYEVNNGVGKMTTKVYTEQILPQLENDLKSRGLTLCHDKDSAHDSKGTEAWIKEHNLSVITLPGVSPDFSIFESMACTLKRKFHTKRTTTQRAALQRFTQIFKEELSDEMVHNQYKWYTKRLHECGRRDGQMTRY